MVQYPYATPISEKLQEEERSTQLQREPKDLHADALSIDDIPTSALDSESKRKVRANVLLRSRPCCWIQMSGQDGTNALEALESGSVESRGPGESPGSFWRWT